MGLDGHISSLMALMALMALMVAFVEKETFS
jgi:hypothetical protein